MADPVPTDRATVMFVGARSILELGVSENTLDDVAERIGVDRDAISFWFPNELELLGELMKARQRLFLDELISRFTNLGGAGAKLRAVIELAIADYDSTLWIELWRLALTEERAREIRIEIYGRYRELIQRLITAGCDSGEFACRSSDRATVTLIALIDGISLQGTLASQGATPHLMLERCLDLAGRLVGGRLAVAAGS